MRIALAQINTTVGDLAGNAAKILAAAGAAKEQGCALVVFPELATTGYPPQDLLFKKHFIDDQLAVLDQIAADAPLDMLVGFVDWQEDALYNAAAYVTGGQVAGRIHKTLLPTYDVFDEWRYFKAGTANSPIEVDGTAIGVTICEDLWDEGYKDKVAPELARHGAKAIINLSSSPFHAGKLAVRLAIMQRHAKAHSCPVLYCNLVGAQDELIFDGQSMVIDAQGRLVGLARAFSEDLLVAELDNLPAQEVEVPEFDEPAEVFGALTLGVHDYFQKCGFARAVIGLSGGVDSSLVAAVAVEALGASQVIGVAMPSRFTSDMSSEDAEELARNLAIEFHVMPIEESVQLAVERFRGEFVKYERQITVENLQARERGKILMEISNDRNALVLSTGNKTEYALGYTTLYGDMCGGLAVIGDVSKPLVYALCRYFNAVRGEAAIPVRVLEREPSAELAANQVDPFDYERIGPLVDLVVENHKSTEQLLALGYAAEEISRVQRLVRLNEYKRKQAPPVLRVTEKAFGIGRRMPIVNHYGE